MTDFDDDLITDAFAGFTAAAAPAVHATGTAAVRHTVKRRRARTTAALSVLGVLLLAAPALAYASMDRGNQGPPDDIAASTSVPPSPSPSVSVSPSPTVPAGPDGRFTIQQLTTVKIPVASWWDDLTCSTGSIRIARIEDVERTSPNVVGLVSVVHTNLDADSATETAVWIACQPGEVRYGQLVGVDRNEAGKLVSLGVLAKGMISSIAAAPQGGVVVDISDYTACCDTPQARELHQMRTYGWNGSALGQLAGPTTFAPHAERIDLVAAVKSVSWGPVVTGKQGGEYRVATVRLTVHNKGPVASGEFVVLPDGESAGVGAVGLGVPMPGIANGATVELTVKVQGDVDGLQSGVPHRLDVYELGTMETVPDLNLKNNEVTVTPPQ